MAARSAQASEVERMEATALTFSEADMQTLWAGEENALGGTMTCEKCGKPSSHLHLHAMHIKQ
eukprot:2643281-Amphidinium_carterae.2